VSEAGNAPTVLPFTGGVSVPASRARAWGSARGYAHPTDAKDWRHATCRFGRIFLLTD